MKDSWSVDFNTTFPIEFSSLIPPTIIIEENHPKNIKNDVDFKYDLIENNGINNVKNDENNLSTKIENQSTQNDKEEIKSITNLITNDVKNDQKIGKIVFTLSCSDQGQVGVFPEQQENWKWIANTIKKSFITTLKEQTKDSLLLQNNDNIFSDDIVINRRIPFISKKNLLKIESEKNALKDTKNEKNSKNANKINNEKKKKKNDFDSNENQSSEIVTRVLNGFAYTGGSSLASLSVQCPSASGILLFIWSIS